MNLGRLKLQLSGIPLLRKYKVIRREIWKLTSPFGEGGDRTCVNGKYVPAPTGRGLANADYSVKLHRGRSEPSEEII